MCVVLSYITVAEAAQSFNHGVLRLGLAGIDHVINFSYIAKVRMIFFPFAGRNPAVLVVGIAEKLTVREVATEQAKLPHVIGDILANIADSTVRADNNLLVFLCDFLRVLCGLCG